MGVAPGVAVAAEACPNAEFRVGPSASLPDCRAYEQVTPVEKGGGILEKHRMGPGAGGTADLVLYGFVALNGIQDSFGAPGGWYADARTASGWVTSPLPLPASEYQVSNFPGGIEPYISGSLDGRSALWLAHRDGQPEDKIDLWVTRPGGAIEDVGPVTPPGTPAVGGPVDGPSTITPALGTDVEGVSGDLSHIVFRMQIREQSEKEGFHLWPFDTTGREGGSLYEYAGAGNTAPMLVGVDDSGSLVSDCGTVLGAPETASIQLALRMHNAMSVDGNTVFFTARAGTSLCGGPPVDELFARIDNGSPNAHTVAISEPSPADCSACQTGAGVLQPGIFRGASADGSKVFFTTEQPLLGGDSTLNVYEYDFDAPAGERVVRVSGGDATVSSPVAEVEGVTQISEDGSHVYFFARGVLTSTPNGQGQVAHAGANNLYVFERDARYPAGRTAFIADLSEADAALWEGKGVPEVNVTPDGRFLVFGSRTDHLTPDDTSTAQQIFEYDAQTGGLVRVSIGENGYNDNGNTDTVDAQIESPTYGVSQPSEYWSSLHVSADGSYVFFESPDGLTPHAIDRKVLAEHCSVPFREELCYPPLLEEFEPILRELGFITKIYASNVYEYHAGNVYLISDGRDITQILGESNVHLLGTDASGADVFFTTQDPLAPTDIDSNVDIYDARIGGGFPAPVAVPECSGDACQGPLSPAPTLLSPGSEFQAGGENPVSPVRSAAAKHKRAKRKADRKGRRAGRAGRAGVGRGRKGQGRGGRS